jgi:hypothetical protein
MEAAPPADTGPELGPAAGSSGRPSAADCSTVPENGLVLCWPMRVRTSAGDFCGKGSPARAGIDPTSTPAAITAGTAAAGTQRSHVRFMPDPLHPWSPYFRLRLWTAAHTSLLEAMPRGTPATKAPRFRRRRRPLFPARWRAEAWHPGPPPRPGCRTPGPPRHRGNLARPSPSRARQR